MNRRLKAVLFDVDGTLVDSNDAHAQAWVKAFTENGVTVDPAHVRRCIGMGGGGVEAGARPHSGGAKAR